MTKTGENARGRLVKHYFELLRGPEKNRKRRGYSAALISMIIKLLSARLFLPQEGRNLQFGVIRVIEQITTHCRGRLGWF